MPFEHEFIAEMRHRIEHRRAELAGELRDDVAQVADEPYGELAGEAPDLGDASTADVLADTRQAELSRDIAEMRALDAALERMLAGHYGQCIDCGEDIAQARLRAEPSAARCITCQEVYERSHGGFGQPSL
ncbi:MAG: TraR/DksA family transcriptional regulator [Burkholderiaceae bacterium]